jgi:magnesium transporter
MLRLRKNSLILQNIVTQLIREQSRFLEGLSEIYLRDLHDHLLRISESIDIHYELCTNILQVYLSSISNKTNETMKVLTLFAAIFIPLSFIAGIFGMNFEYIPGLKWQWGYYAAIGGMVGLAVGLLVFFKKKGWV